MPEGTNIKDDGSTRDGSTPVPWRPGDAYQGKPSRDVCDSVGEGIATVWDGIRIYHREDHGESPDKAISRVQSAADARRIVASVNAMADLPIGILERMAEQKLAALKAPEGEGPAHG